MICELLQVPTPVETTTVFEKESQYDDLRHLIYAKNNQTDINFEYTQVFSDKNGFIPNLSIFDLLFNQGPKTVDLLKSL